MRFDRNPSVSCSTVGRTSLPLLFIILFTICNDNINRVNTDLNEWELPVFKKQSSNVNKVCLQTNLVMDSGVIHLYDGCIPL